MQSLTRSAWLAVTCLSLMVVDNVSAQVAPLGGNAAVRDRGILGRLGSRFEARRDRFERPAPPAPRRPVPEAALQGARGPQRPTGEPERAPELERSPAGPPDASVVRSAQYATPGYAASAGDAQLASGATPLPPNRLPYKGSGVSLRLPADIPGEVNYVIDDSQQMLIGSGEEQHLRAKGRYEIRFSRGIDDTGRSYGEARYTITEGAYRFAVTEKGWELYRQSDEPETFSIPSRETLPSSESLQPVVPDPLGPSELSELRRSEPIANGESVAPVEQVESTESETLPTPTPGLRSILERE